ncbi:MAG: glycosyltransferase family 9 protein [Bacteroidetes bacterium]|nr:glycosyltransferase family 9 protein [Bacteroidota bacterium]
MLHTIKHILSQTVASLQKKRNDNKQLARYHAMRNEAHSFVQNQTNENSVLIVRLDDIGDFILFAPSLKLLIENFNNQKLFFLGNVVWKPLFENLFPESNIESIWLNKGEWFSNPTYRKEIFEQISEIKPEKILFPSFTRSILLEGVFKDIFPNAKAAAWSAKSGFNKHILNHNYTLLFDRHEHGHELEINLTFVEKYFDFDLPKKQDFLWFNLTEYKLPEKYFVVCMGGNQCSKRWSENSYAKLAEHYSNLKPEYTCIILGGSGDIASAEKFKASYSKSNCIDLTGKTNLIEFAKVCKNAQLIMCNDTSAAHFGALQGAKVFVIANGNRYGRFFPYPKEFKNVAAIFPRSKNFALPRYYDWEGKMNINMINVKDIKSAFNEFLGT